jgi:hypothetical protein
MEIPGPGLLSFLLHHIHPSAMHLQILWTASNTFIQARTHTRRQKYYMKDVKVTRLFFSVSRCSDYPFGFYSFILSLYGSIYSSLHAESVSCLTASAYPVHFPDINKTQHAHVSYSLSKKLSLAHLKIFFKMESIA